jgi:putative heme transporter
MAATLLDTPGGPAAGRRPRWPWWARWALVAVGVVAAAVALRGRVPPLAEIAAAATGARPRWFLAAAVAQAVSVSMFGYQQQRLLRAFGVSIGIGRLTAITYARSAISISLPAGSAVSAGWAFRQFRARGASQRTATTVVVLSGVVSIGALVALAAAGAAVNLSATRSGPPVAVGVAAVGVAMVGVAVVAGLFRDRFRRGTRTRITRGRGRFPAVANLVEPVRAAARAAAAIRRRDWLAAAAFAAMNWVADLLCLFAATRAVGLSLPVLALGGGYLAVQVVRQVPLTPGGVGVIEASLMVALVSAGAAQAPAAAAVLIYRIVSCWAIVPIGLAMWAALQAVREPDPVAWRACPPVPRVV